ncbi:Uncharacterised protein [Pseudomonas aeruginosa]|nr:Uncharacterised protein [Pseudomonas aeruginosa]
MGGPHRAAAATQWRTWKRKEFAARGSRAAAGKLFALEGCGHEAQGVAVPSPGFTTSQGRTGRHVPNGDLADSASRTTASSACALKRTRPTPQRQTRTLLAAAFGNLFEARRGSSIGEVGRRVGEPSFVTCRRRTASVEDDTLSRNLPQQATAYPPRPARCGGRWSNRSGDAGSAVFEGRQAVRGGDGLYADPLDAS